MRRAQPGTARHNRAQPGTTGHNRAQPGTTTGHNRAQPGTTGHNRAQPGTTPGHNRAQPGTTGHNRAQPGTTGHNGAEEKCRVKTNSVGEAALFRIILHFRARFARLGVKVQYFIIISQFGIVSYVFRKLSYRIDFIVNFRIVL
jgi:hypothetical protein